MARTPQPPFKVRRMHLRQRFLNLQKLILSGILLFFGIFLHALFVLERVVMVIDPHHTIDRVRERQVEGGPESRGLVLQSLNRRSDFQKSRPAALDGYERRPFPLGRPVHPFGQVAYA
jgi:hypothetical protein